MINQTIKYLFNVILIHYFNTIFMNNDSKLIEMIIHFN
jgi:hypothetical protein